MWISVGVGFSVLAAWLLGRRRRLTPQRSRRWRWAASHGGLPDRQRMLLAAGAGIAAVAASSAVSLAVAWWLPVGALAGGAGYLAGGWIRDPAVVKRRERLGADLPAILELIGACVAAGSPLRSAVAEVARVSEGPAADDLELVLRHVAVGADDATAWRELVGEPVWAPVARGLARSVDSGTALVELLRREADGARRVAQAGQIQRARAVGVRSVLPLMVCYLPAFLLLGVVPIIGAFVSDFVGGF